MRLRGRRHWRETITVHSVTHTTSGPNTGATTTTLLHHDISADVQPVSNAEVLRHGLTLDRPTYYVRFAESPPAIGDRITWRHRTYRVASVSEGNDIDTQLLIQLDGPA